MSTETAFPKVIDFGVARVTDCDLTTLQTDTGQLIGTLQYMSPEQCAGDSRRLDRRTDVYSLGVVLYELLAGRLPYSVAQLSLPEAIRAINEHDPERISTIDSRLRGNVETIVGKALHKERQERYESVAALADDIRRHLAGQPILSRPPSPLSQLRALARAPQRDHRRDRCGLSRAAVDGDH